jgi:hypothetical protein
MNIQVNRCRFPNLRDQGASIAIARAAMWDAWVGVIFLVSTVSAGALSAQDQMPLRMMLASEAWRDAVSLLMSHGPSSVDMLSDQMRAAIRRRDVTACQRILDVAASDKRWMVRVVQVALLTHESEDARTWLLMSCPSSMVSGVQMILEQLSQSDLEGAVTAASDALLTPGTREAAAMEIMRLLTLARLQLMRAKDASGNDAATHLYSLLWAKDWTGVRVARRVIVCDVAWTSLVHRLAADEREASVAHASAVDRVINALSDRSTEAAWEVLDDVRPTFERMLLLASRQEVDVSTIYGMIATLLLDGDAGRIAAERLGVAAPMLSPDMAKLTFRAWPSDATLEQGLIGVARKLPPEALRASRDELKRAATRTSADCAMHIDEILRERQ